MTHRPLSFVVFGDPQIGLAGANKDQQRFEQAVAYVNQQLPEVSIAVIAGDLTNSQEDYQVAKYRKIESQLRPRVLRLPGNHDIWDFTTHQKFLKDHKMESTWYTYTAEGCEFVILDTPVLNAATPDMQLLKAQQWAWLHETLERVSQEGRRHIFVFGHHPPWAHEPEESGLGSPPPPDFLKTLPPHWIPMFQSEDFNLESFRTEERHRFLTLLDKHKVTLYCVGHTHTNDRWQTPGYKVPALSVAGTTMLVPEVDNSSNGVRLFKVESNGQIKTEFHEIEFQGDLKPPFFPPGTVDLERMKTMGDKKAKGML